MPDANYRLFAWAIENRRPIVCRYQGHAREICPVILGRNRNGEDSVLVWQTGGATSKGPLTTPEWKCLALKNIADVRLGDGAWETGSSHQQHQVCVKDVDYDANPASPYRPRQSLGRLRNAPLA
jgi:hypothetical protein